MKDHKNSEPQVEARTFLEKIEIATPAQVAQSVIAQILLIIQKKQAKL